MPVPQQKFTLVEQASCLLLRMQDLSFKSDIAPCSINLLGTGKMPVPQQKFTLCGTGILPVTNLN